MTSRSSIMSAICYLWTGVRTQVYSQGDYILFLYTGCLVIIARYKNNKLKSIHMYYNLTFVWHTRKKLKFSNFYIENRPFKKRIKKKRDTCLSNSEKKYRRRNSFQDISVRKTDCLERKMFIMTIVTCPIQWNQITWSRRYGIVKMCSQKLS